MSFPSSSIRYVTIKKIIKSGLTLLIGHYLLVFLDLLAVFHLLLLLLLPLHLLLHSHLLLLLLLLLKLLLLLVLHLSSLLLMLFEFLHI